MNCFFSNLYFYLSCIYFVTIFMKFNLSLDASNIDELIQKYVFFQKYFYSHYYDIFNKTSLNPDPKQT